MPALVYVVDDEDTVREVVVKVVRSFGFETEDFASAKAFLKAITAPGSRLNACLLLDVHLAGDSGLDLFSELERNHIELPTVFMTGAGTIPMSVRAMKAGAVEFLTKPLDWKALRAALDQATAQAESIAARRAEVARLRELLARLTPRENAVFPHVVQGKLNKQIATELEIVEQTVKVHRARIMQKLEVGSLAELVRLAERFTSLGIEYTARDAAEAQ